MSNQNDPIESQESSIYFQAERLSGLTTTQLELLAGDFYDYITKCKLPGIVVWLLSVATSVFTFCLPFKITKTEIIGNEVLTEALIRSVISWIFSASIIVIVISIIYVAIHVLKNAHLTVARKDATRWFVKTAQNRCNQSIPIDPKIGIPLKR